MRTTISKGVIVSIDANRIGETLSIDYLASRLDGKTYKFAGAMTIGLANDSGLVDEDFAEVYYQKVLAPIFDSAELPNKSAELSQDKRNLLIELHIKRHRELNPFSKKMPQTRAEYALAKSFGSTQPVALLMKLDGVPRTTIVRRLYGYGYDK